VTYRLGLIYFLASLASKLDCSGVQSDKMDTLFDKLANLMPPELSSVAIANVPELDEVKPTTINTIRAFYQ